MSELCIDCFNKIMERNYTEKMFIMTRALEQCEACGQYKRAIIRLKFFYIYKERFTEWIEDMRYLYGKQK